MPIHAIRRLSSTMQIMATSYMLRPSRINRGYVSDIASALGCTVCRWRARCCTPLLFHLLAVLPLLFHLLRAQQTCLRSLPTSIHNIYLCMYILTQPATYTPHQSTTSSEHQLRTRYGQFGPMRFMRRHVCFPSIIISVNI